MTSNWSLSASVCIFLYSRVTSSVADPISPSAPYFPTPSALVLTLTSENKFYTHTKQANQMSILEEIKNRLITGMPAIISCSILSSSLLFKNEIHRTVTLQGGVRLAYVKCVREFGWGEKENCVKGSLWLVLYCVGDGMRGTEWVGCVACVTDSEMVRMLGTE